MRHVAVSFAAIASLPAIAFAAPPAASDEAKLRNYGRHLARECNSCHRIDGVDNGIPSIVAWDRGDFVRTLQYYKKGLRTNPIMVSVAQSLEDDQMQALAAYYGGLPKPPKSMPAPKSKK